MFPRRRGGHTSSPSIGRTPMPLLEPEDDVQSAAEEHRPVLRIEKAPILVQEVFEAKGWREYDEEEVMVAGKNT